MNRAVGQKAIAGAFWMLCSFGFAKVVGLAANIALARLLFPEDFGVFAIAAAVVGAVSALGDLGTGAAVIYEQEAEADHTNSAFWLSMLAGVLQSVVVIVSAPWIGELYGNHLLGEILMVLGVVFVITAAGETHQMLLARELRFKPKALLELVPGLSSAAISVVAAFQGLGVWSLVVGLVLGSALASALAWLLVPWRPFFRLSVTHARAVFRYGRSVMGLGLLIFLTDNVDYLIIGRILGPAPLGLYSQGFRLATYPETTVVWAVQKVAFPTFSKLRDNQEALRSAFLRAIRFLALVSLPALALLMVLSPQLIPVIYGSKWAAMVVPAQILCFMGMARSVTAVSREMLMAVGRPDISLKCNLVVLPLATAGVMVGTQFGIEGVAVAMTAFLSAGSVTLLLLTNREIDLAHTRVFEALQPGITGSLAILAGVGLFQGFGAAALEANEVWTLVYSILLGCALYVASLLVFSRRTVAEACAIALSFRKGRENELWTGLAR
ncbi:MAG: lipopolysaccharide biosynthesis protein [Chloroflexi bacterium]|nr:lipopolysaccharide biosynthesis protein [Chloroflexota bacterium]